MAVSHPEATLSVFCALCARFTHGPMGANAVAKGK